MQRIGEEVATLGEGPIWDPQAGVLWWIDIIGMKLHKYDPNTGANTTFSLSEKPGTVVLAEENRLALALQSGFYWFDLESGECSLIANPDLDEPETRFNDGKCDPAGRFWAGTMEDAETGKNIGSLFSLSGGKCVKHFSGVGVSNGLAWNATADTMYYIDSPTRKVDAFSYDQKTGTISNRRTAFALPEGMGYPDGMSIDSDDKLWICLWHGWGVIQVDPVKGEILQKLDVPARNVTACAFGGDDLKDLYITTARHGNDDVGLDEQPEAGGLFKTTVDVTGTTFARFSG